jgi:hypothetical protein
VAVLGETLLVKLISDTVGLAKGTRLTSLGWLCKSDVITLMIIKPLGTRIEASQYVMSGGISRFFYLIWENGQKEKRLTV